MANTDFDLLVLHRAVKEMGDYRSIVPLKMIGPSNDNRSYSLSFPPIVAMDDGFWVFDCQIELFMHPHIHTPRFLSFVLSTHPCSERCSATTNFLWKL